jgi:hypothetical protein
MAGVAGFEPTHDGIKTRCLTAWLHPINIINDTLSFLQFRLASTYKREVLSPLVTKPFTF